MKKILCLALVLVSLIGIFVLSSCKNKDNLLLEISDIVGIENENIDNQNRKVSFAVNEDCTEFDFGNISFSLSEEITYKVYADFELTVEIQGNAVLSDGENLFYVAVWHNDNEDKKITYVFSINKSAQHVHSFGEWTVVIEATCTEAGLKKRTCEVCGEQESEVIEAKGHDYDEGQVATEATCTEDGVKTYTCQRDGCGYSCTEVIPKAHIFEKWETIPATCSKPGKEYRECEICSFREETEIPATGIHIFKNDDDSGTCAECGVAFGVLGYGRDDEKRTCTITGVNVDKVADNSIILIKETVSINDIEYTVTAIAENAFQDLQNKPYSVQVEAKELKIGGNAFCGKITSITFAEGSNITTTGDIFGEGENDSLISATIPVSLAGQLSDCKSLQELTLLKDKSSTISSNSFEGFSYLKKVTIGNGITNIESNAFNGCSFLSEVALPVSLKNIGESAFAGCEKLKTISLPAGILAITGNAFEGCELTTASTPITDAAIEALKSNSVTMKTITLICGNIIPESAFQGFSALTEITIPSSVTIIGEGAFNGCSALERITIPENVEEIEASAFSGCSALTSITIPSSVTNIGANAFKECESLESVVFNKGSALTRIIGFTFEGCTRLQRINIPQGVQYIGESAFSGCSALESITIPDSVDEIGANAFSGCGALTSITIPSSVTNIGVNAFSDCPIETAEIPTVAIKALPKDSLTSVKITSGSSITDNAFEGFTKLTSITIPLSVTTIGYSAFSGCSALTEITIPSSVTYIGASAFSGCSALESITIPDSVDEIGANAFSGCGALTSITIPSSVTNIGVNAFSDCPIETAEIPTVAIKALPKDSLTSVKITSGSSITDNAFEGFTKLTSITIPLSVTTIGYSAFSGCSALTEITIPSSVTYIGASAFSGCSALESITIPDSVDEIGANAFSGCTNLVIYAEAASKPGSWSDEWNSNNLPVVWGYATSNEKIELSGFLWGLTGEQASLIKYLGSNEKIIIERTVEFLDKTYTVSKIKGNAFDGSVPLSAVTIPSSVCVIEANAFENYDNLIIYTSEIAKPKFWDSAWKNDAISVVWGNGTSDETIEHHGFKWKFDKDNLQAWIIAYLGQSDTLVLEDTVHFLNNTYTVYKISENAFAGSVSLKSIIIPGTVAVIENSAFSGCPNLTIYAVATEKPEQWMNGWKNDNTIVVWDCNRQKYFAYNGFDFSIDNSNKLILQGYTGAETEVNIPEKVTLSGEEYSVSTIAANAFQGKSNITKVTIPFSVDTIGFAAFKGCDNLQTLTINSSSLTFVKDNGENAPVFANQETQDNAKANMGYLFGIEHHDDNVDLVPDSLQTIELPNMNEIPSFLFYNFVDLQSVELSKNLISIGDLAFRGTGIKAIDLNNCTNIGEYAFYGCENLQTVESTASEISVGQYAFTHCVDLNSESVNSLLSKMDKVTNNVFYDTGVKSLVIPEQFSAQTETPNRPFGDSSPTSVTLPANKFEWLDYINKSQVRTIVFTGEAVLPLKENMFEGFRALENILLPKNTTGFTENVFPSVKDAGRRYAIYCSFGKDQEGLTDNWNKEHRVIWNYKNAGCIDDMHYLVNDVKKQAVLIGVFDDSIDDKKIPRATLSYNNKSYTITISQNVFDYSGATVSYDENHIGYVGNWAVGIEDGHENSVKQILFKEGTVGIIDYAFTSCTGLETIEFKQDVIIGDYAFYGCSSLSSVTIAEEKEVTFVGEWAFTHCTSLTEVNTLIENLKIIPDHAFYNTGITTLTINAEIVDTSAFAYCKSLENIAFNEIAFNENVQINDYAFEGCNNLSNITIADGKKITAIGEGAFSGCGNLSEIDNVIKDVEIIPVKAFYKTGIKQITVSTITTSIESEAFSECNSLTTIIFDFRQGKIIVKGKSFANCSQLNEVRYRNSRDQIELCENWSFGIENDIKYTAIGPFKGEHAIIKKKIMI